MRFHLPALPGQPVTKENSTCAFTQKVRKFAEMMIPRGHEVFIYGDPKYEVNATEYIPCYPASNPPPFLDGAWDEFNNIAIQEILNRAETEDFLGLMGGRCQQLLTMLPMIACEYGIGYGGSFADFRVFESDAWRHTTYGEQRGTNTADGSFFDAVIPAYFEVEDFPLGEGGDYLLYVGRMEQRKGVQIASDVAKELDMPLLMAGDGPTIPDYGEYLGKVGPKERTKLMAGAKVLLAPTIYIEPFGCVNVEAQLCGTPAITTDWGAFGETVINGMTGYRCHTIGEFCWAVENSDSLDRERIREIARRRYSFNAIAPQYESYFGRLETLRGNGFYDTKWEGLSRNFI